jgi:RHS repeat-associated protein
MRSSARCWVLAAVIGVLGFVSEPSAALDEDPLPSGPVSAGEGEPFADLVDPRTGAMTYTYSFQLPTARGISGPSLSLRYNSSTRDREAGYGWGLDLPSIELRPLSGLARFDASGAPLPLGHARYVFQGQPLVKICDVGGACPAEPSTQGHPGWATGWSYYRLQVEGLFARFYQTADRSTWRVQFKGGEVVDFGHAVGEGYGTGDAVETQNHGPGIVRWRPVVRRDLEHPNNVVVYQWRPQGARRILYLSDIYDTPSLSAPTSLSGFAHHTQLSWALNPFPGGNHQSPERAAPDVRLTRVAVASMPWSGNGPREVYRIYTLDYLGQRGAASYNPATQGPLWHHAFLKQISLQGHCRGQFEAADGTIPPNAQCTTTPPQTVSFEYEPGSSIGFITNLSQIEAGPPNMAQNYEVLPFWDSSAIVDFDRDGLPDVVQSWQPRCGNNPQSTLILNRNVAVRESGVSGEPELYCIQNLDADGDPYGPYDFSLRSARPILGYQNRGMLDAINASFRYQCMDAGSRTDTTGILYYNQGRVPNQQSHLAKFFTANSNTVLGAFGAGLGVWGGNDYVAFFARSIAQQEFAPGQAPPDYALGGCHLLDGQFNSSTFYPKWKWESNRPSAWTYPAQRIVGPGDAAEWFVDVDGDGYADALRPDATQPSPDFHRARVAFTQKYGTGEVLNLPVDGTIVGPALVPFVGDSNSPVNSLSPIEGKNGALSGTWDPAPNGRKTQVFYADLNGDGLPDLVTSNFEESGGNLRIRPGDGTGRFSCSPQDPAAWPCVQDSGSANTSYYEANITSATKPWSTVRNGYTYLTFFYLHDVTGDGLADIIRFNGAAPGSIEVWVNMDGQSFACVGAGGSCTIATAYDLTHSTYVADARVAFADMDANGVDDIVLLAKQGIFRASVFAPTQLQPAIARGTRPGQLTRIRTSSGATTRIHYDSIQDLDVAARTNGTPWQHHSPLVEAVVTQLLTEDTATSDGGASPAAPYAFRRKVQYTYSEPAYDNWQRKLVGFRKVGSQFGDEAAKTETTYWFGPCEDATPPSQDANGTASTNFCPNGSDDEFDDHPTFRSWVGRPVRVDRYIPANPGQGVPLQYLWSRYFEYAQPINLFSPAAERHVTFTYPQRIETHLYRPEQPGSPGSSFVPLAGGDRIDLPFVQTGSKTLEETTLVDTNGTVLERRERGDATEGDSPKVVQFSDNDFGGAPVVTCDNTWRCLPRYVSIAEDSGGQLVAKRRTRLTYASGTHDLTLVEGYLEADHFLYRRNDSGGAFSSGPTGMATAGWKWLAHFEYTQDGFVALATGAGAPGTPSRACTRFVPDSAYGQFPQTILNFKGDCDVGASLKTDLAFDRAFGSVVSTTAPDLGVSLVTLDVFGRPLDTFGPSPDQPSPATAQTSHVTYQDLGPVSFVDVQYFTSIAGTGSGTNPVRSVQLLNGLHEPVARLDQGDGSSWIVNGYAERNAAGQTYLTRRSFAAPSATNPTVAGGPALFPPSSTYINFGIDGFGRNNTVSENGAPVLQRTFEPLAIEARDAEQIAPGTHVGAFTRTEMTTRGQVRRTMSRTASNGDITTATTYDVTGNPTRISRTATAGSYSRSLLWDSLGRLIQNYEPNTADPVYAISWMYAWDNANHLVATSDARGCGKDIYYDSLGRVLGEDYSPCAASHAPYTQADPATGLGFEVLNQYDSYESGHVESDGTFADDGRLAEGRVVGTSDRGSHTLYNYDNRGRVRRISRQVAIPLSQQRAGVEYAPHWYETRSDFDHADRLTRRTSGADAGPFAELGGTAETYAYSSRGLLQAMSSAQHGALINNITYEVDGQLTQMQYGDRALSKAAFTYDARRWLQTYKVDRAAPSVWSTPSSNYSLPTIDTKQLMLAEFAYQYDLAGNPNLIEDKAPAADWRDYAAPQRSRIIGYDDLYRVTSVAYGYGTTTDAGVFRSPFKPENDSGDTRPVPLQIQLATRVQNEAFTYDYLGNVTSSTDDLNAAYDRSLGQITNGYGTGAGPNHLTAGNGVQATYDTAGNLAELKVERAATCPSGASGSKCAQWFVYDWDEVGQLARARRWDFPATVPDLGGSLPAESPAWDLNYAYSGGSRVVKSATDGGGVERHTLEVFDTLRFDRDQFIVANGDYERHRGHTHVYLAGGTGHVFYDGGTLPAPPTTKPTRLFLNIGDHLGSASVTIDHTSGEVVERAAFRSHGAIDSDYRTSRWTNAREPYKFTGKEEDIEVGATYFGARYYNAYLGRFISPDPLTIHGLGGDLNPYAYVGGQVMSHVDPFGLQGTPAMPVPQVGSRTDSDGTTVTTSGSGQPSGLEIAARTADLFAKIESTAIGFSGGPYITPGDVHREVANAVLTLPASLLAGALDPTGIIRFTAAASGHPIAPRVIPASKDPKNVSGVVADVGLLVFAVATGTKSGAPEAAVTGDSAATIDTNAVRFTQSNVKGTFADGRAIQSTVDALKGPGGDALAGQIPPIRIFEEGGALRTLDNRRLLTFSEAGRAVPYVWATPAEIAAESWRKFTATPQQMGGWFIRVK